MARTAASTSGLLNIHSKKGPSIRRELRKHQKRQPSRFVFLRQLPKGSGWSHHHSIFPTPGSSSPPAPLLHHHELSPPRCLRAADPAWPRDPNGTPPAPGPFSRNADLQTPQSQPIRGSSLTSWGHKTRSAGRDSTRSPQPSAVGYRGRGAARAGAGEIQAGCF